MGVISLTYSMETDRLAGIKANSVHVDANFNTLLNAVNTKLENDGSILPIADLPMNNHKLTGVATPTLSADAATKGYVDQNACMLAGAQTITGNKSFTGTITATTQTNTDNSTNVATTAFVRSVLEAIYPVGSLYIGTQTSCPMGAFFGTWELVASDKALWTGDGTNGNSTIAAGLPNITGAIDVIGEYKLHTGNATGALKVRSTEGNVMVAQSAGRGTRTQGIELDASISSSVYGNSTTVQPPAYVVNVWRRTA